MAKKYFGLPAGALLLLTLVFGCGDMGKVDQGRVIDFDKTKGIVTMVRDIKGDIKNPDYSSLPPVVYRVPVDKSEMGPEPKAGKRMKLDTHNKQIVIFDPGSQNFKSIRYTLVDQKENVDKDNPLVEGKKFPLVDKGKKTVTLYSKRQRILTTFSLPEEYFNLPENTWEAGDEVRIYYREAGQARRLMNVSKTDIYKK